MGKQVAPYYLTGTFGDLTYYKLYDQWLVRMKSSLTGKRVKKDPKFARTMQFAGWFGIASQLAASAYRQMPRELKQHSFYRELTGVAMGCVIRGGTEEEVTGFLAYFIERSLAQLKAAKERARKRAEAKRMMLARAAALAGPMPQEQTDSLSWLFVNSNGRLGALLPSVWCADREEMLYRRIAADMLLSRG